MEVVLPRPGVQPGNSPAAWELWALEQDSTLRGAWLPPPEVLHLCQKNTEMEVPYVEL